MNELSKVFSSVLMLVVGFGAASLFGPPEVIDRLAWRINTLGGESRSNLAPLPQEALPELPTEWPPLDATAAQAAPLPAPPSTPAAVEEEAFGLASWPTQSTVEATTAPATEPSGADDWLTADSLWRADQPATTTAAPPIEPTRPEASLAQESRRMLAPVERVSRVAPPSEAFAAETAPGPAPLPTTPQFRSPQGPTLDDNPYAPRRPSAAQAAAITAPLTLAAPTPIARPATAETFTQHVVTDGDTLPTLAERYLGDATRAEEVFRLNSDRLEHPDLLPIGIVLRLPEAPITRHASKPAQAVPHAFPPLAASGPAAFSSVSAATSQRLTAPQRGPLQPVAAFDDDSALPSAPVDAVYHRDAAWGVDGW